ncbi:MAG: hypothetical protein ACFCU2_03370, partial [Acidimicrobiia bacterium]
VGLDHGSTHSMVASSSVVLVSEERNWQALHWGRSIRIAAFESPGVRVDAGRLRRQTNSKGATSRTNRVSVRGLR